MSYALTTLVGILAVAIVAAAWAARSTWRRRLVLGRTDADVRGSEIPGRILLGDADSTPSARAGRWIERLLPPGFVAESGSEMLVRAGFDGPAARPLYAMARVVSAAGLPVLTLLVAPRDTTGTLLLSLGVAISVGMLAPPFVLRRLARSRGERVRHSLPDCLDLLLVCVEAGVSLDAAVLRVGREMSTLHPELSNELLVVNRRTNAGMRRDEALHALYTRTGVEELRSLASSMIQSERWGSSIGKVLRVYSESLRRKRRQRAEKKAAVAAAKMIFPVALFILPALFAIIGGPVMIGLRPVLEALTNR